MKSGTRSYLLLFCLGLNCSSLARAEYDPIALAPGSYNYDVVIEKAAPPPAVPVTSASMETGGSNTGFTWFERGYLSEWPATGLPEADSLLTSDLLADHHFRMPPSYRKANAFLIDATRGDATVVFTAPTNYVALSLLTSSGISRSAIRYILNHSDGSSETGAFTSPNWYNDGDPAWAANGRVNVSSFVHADLNSYNPRLYSADITVSNDSSPITQLTLTYAGGNGHAAIFAVSGASSAGSDFNPVSIAGYNEDLVVEASAVKPGFMETNTTATMDSGTANTRFTWYEQGYNPVAPTTGLPAPGSLVKSAADGNHCFLMPPSYVEPNAILVDSACTSVQITPLKPASYSALSLLTASSHGSATNQCIVTHANGKAETNRFVSPDWQGDSPAAVIAHGCASVSTRLVEWPDSDTPRLFTVDVPLTETVSAVTHLRISTIGSAAISPTVIFAVSGISTSPDTSPALSISRSTTGQITIRSTKPGWLESCTSLYDAPISWRDEGEISQEINQTPSVGQSVRFFRLVAP